MGDLGITIFWSKSMNKDLNKFVDEYIALCEQLCQKAEDYTRENVVTHNRAVKKLNSLLPRFLLGLLKVAQT